VISNRNLLIPAGFKEFVTLFKIGTFLGVLGGGVGCWLEHGDAADTLNSTAFSFSKAKLQNK
jgi:hypothetical protein